MIISIIKINDFFHKTQDNAWGKILKNINGFHDFNNFQCYNKKLMLFFINLFTLRFCYLKEVTLQLTWMSFLQNREVLFNQESLPITYDNFRHKSLVRPKSKSPNWQGSQLIRYKTKFSQRDNIYLVDLKYNITYQNICGKTKVRSIFMPWKA